MNQHCSICGERFTASDRAHLFAGFGFDVDLIRADFEELGESLPNPGLPGGQPRTFGVNGAVEVDDFPMVLSQSFQERLQQVGGVCVEESGAGVREPFADVTETGCAQQSIDDGVNKNIRVAVAVKAAGSILDQNASQKQWSADDGAVGIVSFADAEGSGMHGGEILVLCFGPGGSGLPEGGRIAEPSDNENSALGRQFLLISRRNTRWGSAGDAET